MNRFYQCDHSKVTEKRSTSLKHDLQTNLYTHIACCQTIKDLLSPQYTYVEANSNSHIIKDAPPSLPYVRLML